MTQPVAQPEQVEALFSERQRFEEWLSALESKRQSTPLHIYTRVHADYTARLQRVIEQLGTFVPSLMETERSLVDRLASLDIEEAKKRDEAAEAELRATVGELTADRHAEVRDHTERTMTELREERTKLQSELARLRQMLDAARPAGTPTPPNMGASSDGGRMRRGPAPAESRAPAPAPDDWDLSFEDPLAKPAAPPPPPPQSAAPQNAPASFDDLEFLKSLHSRSSGEQPAVPPARPPAQGNPRSSGNRGASAASAPAPVSAGKPSADVMTRAPSASTAVSTPPPVEIQPEPEPVAPIMPPLMSPMANPVVDPTPPRAAAALPEAPAVRAPKDLPYILPDEADDATLSRDSLPAYLRDAPPEQVKTLKCQECGTLNYPTEWYCERCGAELAAL